MSARTFDQKFGSDFLAGVSLGPGVYRYLDRDGVVIYVGKAKNLRRRLQGYRNASLKKVHRKMRRIVKAAAGLEVEELPSEEAALLRENELIRELSPLYNVDGAYAFLYPAIGVGSTERHTLLCFTTQPELFATHGLSWFGTFRSRPRAKLAFESLVELLGLIGHLEKRSALPKQELVRGARFVGLRQVPLDLKESLPWFFAGDDSAFLGELARLLLSKPRALREAGEVQEKLVALKSFYEMDAVRLRAALRKLGRPGSFVAGQERDALFIRSQFEDEKAPH